MIIAVGCAPTRFEGRGIVLATPTLESMWNTFCVFLAGFLGFPFGSSSLLFGVAAGAVRLLLRGQWRGEGLHRRHVLVAPQ